MSSEQVAFWTLANVINNENDTADLVAGLEIEVRHLNESNIENTSNIATLSGDVTTLTGQVGELEIVVGSYSTAITDLQNTTATNTSNIGDLQITTSALSSTVADLNIAVGTLSSDVSGINIEISDLQNTTATNTSNIGTLQTDTSTNTSNIATNTSNIATNTTNIGTNTSNIATNTTNIGTNTSNIATLTTKLGTSADIGTTTAWGQANLSRSINRLSTVLRSSANIPASYGTLYYGIVQLPLLDTGNAQERTLGCANFTVQNNTNSIQNINVQIIVNGVSTEIVTSVPAGIGHSTTISISGASASVVTSGNINIQLQAYTPNANSLTPKYVQIWGIGQLY